MLLSALAAIMVAGGPSVRLVPPCSGLPTAPVNDAVPNDNRQRAGTLRDGVLTVRLVARPAAWRPDGPNGCALSVNAFAEEGKPTQVPGPLIRVNLGTEVRVTVRNALATQIWVRGLQDRAAGGVMDSADVAAGASREFRFVAKTRGSWHYWAGGAAARVPSSDSNGQLVGALVIDSLLGTETPRADRILVLTRWNPNGATDNKGFQLNAFNGQSWPNTERLTYPANDSVRWQVINASNIAHEMHLHGFFFRIDRRGFAIDSIVRGPQLNPMRVTSVLRPSEWLQISWLPDRPGNWLYHCHLLTHMSGAQRLDRMGETEAAAHERDHATDTKGSHADHDMGGLVMALDIRPPRGSAVSATPSARARSLHLYANARAGRFGDRPGYGFVLQEGTTPPARDSVRMPGSPIVLMKGEAAAITVHNRLTSPISVHWHGIELDSYNDGVGGFSGLGRRIAPMIAPRDSFTARFTPMRDGTYMYHIHGERGEELASGLYGVLVVADSATPFNPRAEPLVAIANGGPGEDKPIFINGSASPDTLELAAGTSYRFRVIYITSDDVILTTLRGPAGLPVTKALALDAAESPDTPLRAWQFPTGPGHTRDVVVTFGEPGVYRLEVQRVTGGATTTLPIRVN